MRKVHILPITILLLASACRKEKFKADSKWIAPVLETELTLGDIVPDSLLSENANGDFSVVFEEEYGVGDLEDILQIPDRVEEVEVSLTSLVLDDRSFTDTLTLFELYPPSLLLNGTRTTLDAQEIDTEEGTVLDVTEEFFTTATFLEGFIDISISNDLPVEAEVLEFQLRNDDDKEIIVSGVFNNLAPGAEVSETYDLAGKTVDGVLELIVIKVKTAASAGEVLIEANKGIRTTITVRDLKPQVATAIFPAQNLVERKDETQYSFGGAQLREVYVKEGFILMKVESSIEEAIILDYTIPNSEKIGVPGPITQTWRIPPAPKGETIFVEERFSIADFRIFLYGKSNAEEPDYNHIYNELVARIEFSGIERTLSLDDKIKIEFGLVDVKPILVIGDPGEHKLDALDTFELKAFDDLSGGLTLEDAELDINLYNSFGIQALLDVKSMVGVNNTSKDAVALQAGPLLTPILLEKAINPPLTADEKELNINQSNSNLKLFLENLPSKIYIDVKAEINPNGTIDRKDFAFDRSELKANFKLTVPLNVGLENFSFNAREAFTLSQVSQIENVKSLDLRLAVLNDFPIGGRLNLIFYDESGDILFATDKKPSMKMEAAEVDPLSGKTLEAAESNLELSLTEEETSLIKIATRVGVSALFDTENGSKVKLYSDYKIDLKLFVEALYESSL